MINVKFIASLRRQPIIWMALTYIILVILLSVGAPFLAPHDPLKQNLMSTLQLPSGDHWLGTDHLGRDTFSRILFGGQASLWAAFQAVTLASVVGITVGLVAGYSGAWVDRLTMWITETIYALPLILIAISLIAVIGTGLSNAMFAVGLVLSTGYIRLTRGLVFAEREKLYVESAKVGGLSWLTILFWQILPNIAPALIIHSALTFGVVILVEASLSFLGLGVEIGQPSWGLMLSEARTYIRVQPFIIFPPGLAITLTVLAFNLLGDGLRDWVGGNREVAKQSTFKMSTTPEHNSRTVRTINEETVPLTLCKGDALLCVQGLEVILNDGKVPLLSDVGFEIKAGQTMGLVGESGSGKTLTALSLLGMLPPPLALTAGSMQFDGQELTQLEERQWRHVRGNEIAMIFQNPLAALNPTMTIGSQLIAPLRAHTDLSRRAAKTRALELLHLVGIPPGRFDEYPHQFSGGMAQRVGIARALTANPRLLIADEPTTALDVVLQKQILDLLADLQEQFAMAMLLISHDLGVITHSCSWTAVMYSGQIVEQGTTEKLFRQPHHPYTADLLATMPQHHMHAASLPIIPGRVPNANELPSGCRYHPRCRFAVDTCRVTPIAFEQIDEQHMSRCIRIDEIMCSKTQPGVDYATTTS